MMFWLKQLSISIEKRKVRNRLNRFVDLALRKYKIPADCSNYYHIGQKLSGKERVSLYISGIINPLFSNIVKEHETLVERYRKLAGHQVGILEIEETGIDEKLNANKQGGYIKDMQWKIDENDRIRKDVVAAAEHEKVLYRMIDKALVESANGMSTFISANEEFAILNESLKQKRVYEMLSLNTSNYKKAVKKAGFARHSLLTPPKKNYVRFFFTMCLLLLFAEIGFSFGIINGFMDLGKIVEPIFGNTSGLVKPIEGGLSVLFCLGISISFVVFWKLILDRFLHSNLLRTIMLVLIAIMVFVFLSYFFSSKFQEKDLSKLFATKGVIIAFFSVMFAFANALLFREATYLHGQIMKGDTHGKTKKLEKKLQKYRDRWGNKLRNVQERKVSTQNDATYFDERYVGRINGQLNDIKANCIGQLNQGYSDAHP